MQAEGKQPVSSREPPIRIPLSFDRAIDGLLAVKPKPAAKPATTSAAKKPAKKPAKKTKKPSK